MSKISEKHRGYHFRTKFKMYKSLEPARGEADLCGYIYYIIYIKSNK